MFMVSSILRFLLVIFIYICSVISANAASLTTGSYADYTCTIQANKTNNVYLDVLTGDCDLYGSKTAPPRGPSTYSSTKTGDGVNESFPVPNNTSSSVTLYISVFGYSACSYVVPSCEPTTATKYSISGTVKAKAWPYTGIPGVTVTADTGDSATTDPTGAYTIPNVPAGTRTVTATHSDYFATGTSVSESLPSFSLTSNVNGKDFTNFNCKGTPQVTINPDKTTVAPGDTFNVTVTLKNTNYALSNVKSYLDISFIDSKVTVGTPTGTGWTSLTTFPTGSSIWGVTSAGTIYNIPSSSEYLISGERQGAFGSNGTYSYTVPLTVKTGATGSITLKYRGTIGEERDPLSSGSGTLDQQGWNVKTLDVTVGTPQTKKIPILAYHEIGDHSTPYWLTKSNFEQQMVALKAYGYQTVSLTEVYNYAKNGGTLPDKPVVITFDDGYENFYKDAYPVLRQSGFTATNFLISDFIASDNNSRKTNTWDVSGEERSFNSTHLIWPEVTTMIANGFNFESHSTNHVPVTTITLSTNQFKDGATNSKTSIESKLTSTGAKVSFFSYPYGHNYSLTSTVPETDKLQTKNILINAGYTGAVLYLNPVPFSTDGDFYAMDRIVISRCDTIDVAAPCDVSGLAHGFFMSKVNPDFAVPSITIDSIKFVDKASGQILTKVSPGQPVKVRVSATNSGSPQDVVLSVNIDDLDTTNGLLYDSHQTTPAQDLTFSFGKETVEKDFDWTVPAATSTSTLKVIAGFHDTYYVLGYAYSSWDSNTIAVQPNKLDIKVTNIPGGSTLVPQNYGKVALFKQNGTSWNPITTVTTDTSGVASFSNLTAGTYKYKVYVNYKPSGMGEEYWGEKEVTYNGWSMTDTFVRNMPYISNSYTNGENRFNVRLFSLNSNIYPNLEVTSPSSISYQIKAETSIDRLKDVSSNFYSKSSYEMWSSLQPVTMAFQPLTGTALGPYYRSSRLYTFVDGAWLQTDTNASSLAYEVVNPIFTDTSCSLNGYVYDDSNPSQVVPGAGLALAQNDLTVSLAKSGQDGGFKMNGVPCGNNFVLYANLAGYQGNPIQIANISNLISVNPTIVILKKLATTPATSTAAQDSNAIKGRQPLGSKDSGIAQGPVNPAMGNHFMQYADVTVPIPGNDLVFSRYYDTLYAADEGSPIGYGWKHNWLGMVFKPADMPNRVIVLLPNGHTEHFDADAPPPANGIQSFTPVLKDTTSKLSYYSYTNSSINYYLFTTRDHQEFYYRDKKVNGVTVPYLTRWIDSNGRSVLLDYNDYGVMTIGRGYPSQINISYDANGMIEQVSGPEGQVVNYSRDSSGNLVTVTLPAVNDSANVPVQYTNKYTYYDNNHLLKTAVDERNVTYLQNEYDSRNRLVKQYDATGVNPTTYLYDDINRVTTITDRNGNKEMYFYDQNYRLVRQITDPLNLSLSRFYSYDNDGRRVSQTDANGNVTNFSYDTNGNLKTVTLPYTNLVTTNTYDVNNNVIRVDLPDKSFTTQVFDLTTNNLKSSTDQEGNTTNFEYNLDGLLSKVTDPNGTGITTYEYDLSGNLTKQTDPEGNIAVMTYDGAGRLKSRTIQMNSAAPDDLKDVTYSYTYDALGRKLTETDPEGIKREWKYIPTGKVAREIDLAGNVTVYDYYPDTELLKTVTMPQEDDGKLRQIQFTYDKEGRLLTRTEPGGNITQNVYDTAGRLKETIVKFTDSTPDRRTSYTYDNNGNLKSSTYHPMNRTTKFVYDALNRKEQEISPTNGTTYWQYDEMSRVKSVIDAELRTVGSATYYKNGLSKRKIDGMDNYTEYIYDRNGNLTSINAPLNRNTTLAYYRNNRLKDSTTNPLVTTSSQEFDAAGRRKSFTDPNKNKTQFTFDRAGRTLSVTPPGNPSGSTSFAYTDKRGLLTSSTNARGQSIDYSYYNSGLLKSVKTQEETISHTYDLDGRPLDSSSTFGNATVKRSYYADGRMKSRTDEWGLTLGYEYFDDGSLKSITYPDGKKVVYGYYDDGRLKTVTDWNSRVATYSYDKAGVLKSVTLPDGSVQLYSYDNAMRLQGISDTKGSTVISRYEYQLDNAGQRTGATVTEPILQEAPSTAVEFSYQAGNQQATANGINQTYDADGNTTSGYLNGASASFTFDSLNRLTSAAGTTYRYGIDGHRISTTTAGVETRYVVNPSAYSQVLEERTATGAVTARYVYGLGLISRYDGDGTSNYRVYHFDPRGSTLALTDSNGTITQSYSYDIFGKTIKRNGATIANPFLYNGRDGVMEDGNGLNYMRARFYNPDTRRFLSRDSLLGSVDATQSLNRYSYVNGNPISMVDPLGLLARSDIHTYLEVCSASMNTYTLILALSGVGAEAALVPLAISATCGAINTGLYYEEEGLSLNTVLSGVGTALDGAGVYAAKSAFKVGLTVEREFNVSGRAANSLRNMFNAADKRISEAVSKYREFNVGEEAANGFSKIFNSADKRVSEAVSKYREFNVGEKAVNSFGAFELRFFKNYRTSYNRIIHLLIGDHTGGGHLYPGKRGKTPFPSNWGPNKIIQEVESVANDPLLEWNKGRVIDGKQRYDVTGVRDGVFIKVAIEPSGEGIITSHPLGW